MEEDKFIIKGNKREHLGDYNNYGELLLKRLALGGDKIAQICFSTGVTRTFEQIRQNIIQMSLALKELGVNKGDVISISSENSLEFSVFASSIFCIGAIVAPLNPNYVEGEIYHALNLLKPKIILCSKATFEGTAGNIFKKTPTIEKIILTETKISPCSKVILFEDLMRRKYNTEEFRVEPVDIKTHPIAVLSSSGTTGMPKGVLLSHNNILCVMANLKNILKINALGPNDCQLSLLPWYHAFGLITTFASLVFNSKIVFMKKFQDEAFLKCLQDYKVTFVFLVPPLIVFLAKHHLVDKYDLSSLREIKCGAAPISKEIQETVSRRIKLENIGQAYGMTETTLAVLNYVYKPTEKQLFGCVGKIEDGMECKVVDENDKALGPNQRGQLCFRGDLVMLGYLNNPKETAQTIDKNGWLHTGDIAYYDEDFNFYIVDRLKELIKYKAFQVAPAELEAILLQHSGVKDAGVVGLPEESAGELPLAFVAKQPNSNVTEKELIDFVSSKVSNPKRLRGGVRFVNEIPKNPSGKILRRQLRQMLKIHKSNL